MTRQEIIEKLELIFHDILNPNLILTDDLNASMVDEWDSLNHITLIVEIESKFAIELSTSELAELSNVGEMIALIGKKVNSK